MGSGVISLLLLSDFFNRNNQNVTFALWDTWVEPIGVRLNEKLPHLEANLTTEKKQQTKTMGDNC